ncbi:MAG: extracellular solute-binding protein [Ruminococcaceae bacterium]|nr:extracellular solute-binding protein [Oscillospiraceae bacterium]
MKKRTLICLILAGLLTASCGTSVPGGDTAGDTTTAEPEIPYLETLGEKDFGGKTFTILGVHYAARPNFADEAMTGEVVNDALAKRDSYISEKYNVNLEFVVQGGSGATAPLVKQSVLADEDNYNLAIDTIAGAFAPLVTQGILMDMNSLPTLDLSREWWSPMMYENTTLDGKMYVTMGDIAPQKYYAPYALCFNVQQAEKYQLPDLYQMVLDGKWTLEQFGKMSKDVTYDLDGNGTIDYNDFYGFARPNTGTSGLAFITGAGGRPCTIENNEIVMNINNERTLDIAQKVFAQLDMTGIKEHNTETNAANNEMFKSGRALFYGNSLSVAIAEFREMEDDFGIIPVPKYDEAQDGYCAYINTWCLGGSAVPATVQDTEMTGFIMEALCYKSYEDVRPALYEVVIKQKVSRDDATAQVLDIIYDNTYLDFNGIYDFAGSQNFIGDVAIGNKEFASGYAAIEPAMIEAMEKFREQLS